MPFQALEMKCLDSITFQVFHDPCETRSCRRRLSLTPSQRRTHVATTEEDQFGLVTNLSHTKL